MFPLAMWAPLDSPDAAGFRVSGVMQHPTPGDIALHLSDGRSYVYFSNRAFSRKALSKREDDFDRGDEGKWCAFNSGFVLLDQISYIILVVIWICSGKLSLIHRITSAIY